MHTLLSVLIHAHVLIFTPQLAGEARQLGCPKIVLDHVCTGPCKLMNIAIRTNCIKYQMLHVFLT